MDGPRWTIRVKRWNDYLHYAGRRPTWIKLQASILEHESFMELPPALRWAVVGTILLVARMGNAGTLNTTEEDLKMFLGMEDITVQHLMETGFFEIKKYTASVQTSLFDEQTPKKASTKKKAPPSVPAVELAKRLANHVLSVFPNAPQLRKPRRARTILNWAHTFDLMLRRGEATPQEIDAVLDFLKTDVRGNPFQRNGFPGWGAVIQSADKIRDKWGYLIQAAQQMDGKPKRGANEHYETLQDWGSTQ